MKSVSEHKNSCKHLLKKIHQSNNPNPNLIKVALKLTIQEVNAISK